MKTVDTETIFEIAKLCDPVTRYPGIAYPFSPRSGLVVATDGWLIVGLNSEANLPPSGTVPDVLVFEKEVAEHTEWKPFGDIITVPQPCNQCGSKRFVFDDIVDIEGESLDLFKRSVCPSCDYEISGVMFSMELYKRLTGVFRPAFFAVVETVAESKKILFKSDYGFGILMARKQESAK